MEQVGLPLGVILAGYGSLALGPGGGDPWGPLRLVLHLVAVLLIGRVGRILGLNRTAALLAGLFYAASPLAAYSLGPGSPLAAQIWVCLLLGAVFWGLNFRRPGPVGLLVMAVMLPAGAVGAMVLGGQGWPQGFAWGHVPGDLLFSGARLVLPAPLAADPVSSPVPSMLLGAVVWGFWILMAVHRALLDNPLPRNLLLLTGAAVLPLLGHAAEPASFLPALAMFSLFIMGFLRPSKLVDSPRILMLAAFFLVLLARTTATVLGS